MKYLEAMKNRLTDDQKDILKRIYAPTVVATPLFDSRKNICILPDGEIRAYGKIYVDNEFDKGGQIAYLSSTDCGLSWNINYSNSRMNYCTYIEKGDIYITTSDRLDLDDSIDDGLYVFRSKIGPDDKNPEVIKICDGKYYPSAMPRESKYSNRIWFATQKEGSTSEFFFSDDFGITWENRSIPDFFDFQVEFPHKGKRWSVKSNTEPDVVELSENEMVMIIRTPMDCFYMSYSHDGGNSWSVPEPSSFYGTNTTACMLTLSDGRMITFWNNTKPLAEENHRKLNHGELLENGIFERGFTNRDAAHAAISSDGGKTFVGYREILLNPVRNNADFRYIGGPKTAGDRSVHQFQAFELPYNKLLVSAGQNTTSRRIVIFDIDWLYETSRKETFINGMSDITAHTYLKSVIGCQMGTVGNGHCARNRTYSAYPMPDPDGTEAEVLYISKRHDDRLLNDISGICWNFPMSRKGKISTCIKIVEKQARFILTDRWYNTCDPYAAYQSPFWFEIDGIDTGEEFCNIDIEFDVDRGFAEVYGNNEKICSVRMSNDCPTGISYLIMQCATDGDSKGFYVKSMEKCES